MVYVGARRAGPKILARGMTGIEDIWALHVRQLLENNPECRRYGSTSDRDIEEDR